MLQPEEIFPKEIAHSQEPGERGQHVGAFQRRQLVQPIGLLEKLGEEVTKVQQCRLRIGRARQQVREVLDEHDGRPQLALTAGIGDFFSRESVT